MTEPERTGWIGQGIALVWGLAEATLFFIVPDVWLSVLATRGLRSAMIGVAWALAGALAGGAAMWWCGAHSPDAARAALDGVPAISARLIANVGGRIEAQGLWAVLLGPLGGEPYKIFAVDWGARGGSLPAFLLVSIPARGARFVLSALLTAWALRGLARWTRRRGGVELGAIALFWTTLYAFYFWRFGW